MRSSLPVLALLIVSATASADDKPRSLSIADVTAQLAPVSSEIERCYLDRAAGGKLELTVTVTRKGAIESLAIKMPGVAPKLAKQIDGCIRPLVEPVAFPQRKTFTTATVPYFFLKTAAPGSGPQLSCWDAAGCPTK